MNIDQLKAICKNQKQEILIKFLQPLNDLFIDFEINTPTRQSFYLANCLHECGEFRWLKEINPGNKYEFRLDLGNKTPGDGVKYIGRGVLAVTGRINYQKLSDYFKVDFIKQPELLETPEYAVKSSGYFWKNNNLNKWCDTNDFLQVVYRINGGQNGLQERLRYLVEIYKVLNYDGLDKLMNNIFDVISNNISTPIDSRFSKLLLKAVPDNSSLNNLKTNLKYK